MYPPHLTPHSGNLHFGLAVLGLMHVLVPLLPTYIMCVPNVIGCFTYFQTLRRWCPICTGVQLPSLLFTFLFVCWRIHRAPTHSFQGHEYKIQGWTKVGLQLFVGKQTCRWWLFPQLCQFKGMSPCTSFCPRLHWTLHSRGPSTAQAGSLACR